MGRRKAVGLFSLRGGGGLLINKGVHWSDLIKGALLLRAVRSRRIRGMQSQIYRNAGNK